ncbi:hypothetical protein KKF91_13205 [Myxococcota bacterium]|nr:hypothetical protein [Myxococcota bacterium]MBU1431494.1 hypothetical protein [Myxococcota bacterium]MBU1900616.1 hypothetical protein [Myxococcota bacterium]
MKGIEVETKRPFLGIYFECCRVYARIYPNKEGTHYVGRCPRCLKPARFQIGEGGSDQRIWRVR